jgi:hypothetical protein
LVPVVPKEPSHSVLNLKAINMPICSQRFNRNNYWRLQGFVVTTAESQGGSEMKDIQICHTIILVSELENLISRKLFQKTYKIKN